MRQPIRAHNTMEAIINTIEKRYFAIIVLSMLIVAGATLGVINLKFDPSIRAYIDPESPEAQQLAHMESDFGKQENIVIIATVPEDHRFTPEQLKAIAEITEQAWKTPYSRRVESPTNYPVPQSADGEIASQPVIDSAQPITAATLQTLEANTNDSHLLQRLINPALNFATIVVHLNLDDSQPSQTSEVVSHVESLLTNYQDTGLDLKLMGTTVINESIKDAIIQDALFLVPTSTTIIVVVLLLVLRVISGTILTTTLLSLTNMIVVGVFGWFGTEVTPGAGAIPTMITIIAVADAIHFLSTYYHELSLGKEKNDAIKISFRINFVPMAVTSVTTAIGLLCLNFSESPPYRDMGNMVAFGALVAFLLTVTLLPALLFYLPRPKHLSQQGDYRHFEFAAMAGKHITAHPYAYLIGVGAVSILLLASNAKNELNDNWEDYFDETFAVKQSINLQNDRFNGAHFAEYVVTSPYENGVTNAEFMQDLERLSDWLAAQPEVRYVNSLAYILSRINQLMQGNNQALPNDSAQISQLLFLYELSLPFGFNTEELISFNKDKTKLSLSLDSLHSDQMLAFDQRVLDWVENNTSLQINEGSGVDMIFAKTSHRNIHSIALGTFVALVSISILLIWVLKSFKLGLISLVPNLLPVGLAYGAWGATMSHIDMAISLVGAMSLGLVVDDTVHFMSKYRYAKDTLKQTTRDALVYAFSTVGFALTITSLILIAGFSSMIFSHFDPTWTMGALLSITIFFALVVDFLLLPSLLLIFDNKDKH